MQSKVCSKCKEEKVLTEFHTSNREPCGYKSACKVCRNKYNVLLRKKKRDKFLLDKSKIMCDYDPLLNKNIRFCNTCGDGKSLDNYYSSPKLKLGKMYQCSTCQNEVQKFHNKKESYVKWKFEYRKQYRIKNREKLRLKNRVYTEKNIDKIREKNRRYVTNNPEKVKKSKKDWADRNPHKLAERRVRRRVSEKLSIPSWSESEKIKIVYQKAKWLESITGLKYHVDHLIPIQGKDVCGLHVWANLQILEASLNCSKQDTYEKEW